MKAYSVSLYLICFNLALSVLVNLQVFTWGTGVPPVVFGYDAAIIEETMGFLDLSIGGLDVIDLVAGLATFVQAILNATFLLPFFLAQFGIPAWAIPLVVVPCAYTYLAALVQLLTGRILPLFE